MFPMGGVYIDSDGQLRNLDGTAVNAVTAGYSPFSGDFYDSGGNIRNIDSLGGGGSSGDISYATPEDIQQIINILN
jgi:hypothetical protein